MKTPRTPAAALRLAPTLISALVLAAALVGCEQDAATLAKWVDNSLQGGRLAEAERYLARLKARDGGGRRFLHADAEVKWKKRDFAGSEAGFKAALEVGRGDKATTLRLHFRLGLMLHEAGRFADAESEFAGVAKFEPGNVAALVWQGRAAADATRYEAARQVYDAALRIDKNHLEARTDRVRCLIALGDLKAASAELDWLRERAPTDAWVRVLDGMVDQRKGSKAGLEDAEKSFRKAWELQKRTAFPHVALADFLLGQGKVDEAAGVLLGVPRKHAEAPGVLLRRGKLARMKGDRAEATRLLEQALKECPREPVGPKWPDPARIDFTPRDLREAIAAELKALGPGARDPGQAAPASGPAAAASRPAAPAAGAARR
ncbi:MAG: tetratricopeptide repeat protein [Deltaproteobacteria bacterium]|nr:tetratricopeptide repeat protein [Deltaproteobacteria bacterium]